MSERRANRVQGRRQTTSRRDRGCGLRWTRRRQRPDQFRSRHHERYAYSAGQTYFPDGVARQHWYQPANQGAEIKIGEKLGWLRSLDTAADGTAKP
ncbi:hypothetical protein KEC55_26650 [Burkholderia cepacia]|nr:hypothetical protein [Burkholderia cepacia]WGY72851.1 hypothetical protein KEC55_26650 [Burkholderia cepacia]